jgi:methionyl-tRNA formyltransferase
MPAERRAVFLGTPGPLSDGVLRALIDAQTDLAGVIAIAHPPSPVPPGALPVAQPDGLDHMAAEAGVSVAFAPPGNYTAMLSSLRMIRPTLVVVACLAWRLDAALLTSAVEGFWNVHPSLLPRYRGPSPLFWQLRDGLRIGGVSIHRMTPRFDAGPLAAAGPVPLPLGIAEPQAEYAAGARGGEILARLLHRNATPWPVRPQRPQLVQYQANPTADCFRLEANWSLEHVWRFMRGVAWRRQPFRLAGHPVVRLREAKEYRVGAAELSDPTLDGNDWLLPFDGGILVASRG